MKIWIILNFQRSKRFKRKQKTNETHHVDRSDGYPLLPTVATHCYPSQLPIAPGPRVLLATQIVEQIIGLQQKGTYCFVVFHQSQSPFQFHHADSRMMPLMVRRRDSGWTRPVVRWSCRRPANNRRQWRARRQRWVTRGRWCMEQMRGAVVDCSGATVSGGEIHERRFACANRMRRHVCTGENKKNKLVSFSMAN